MKSKISIFWFRRDLRLVDNHGLAKALATDLPVLPIFIFDSTILDQLEDKEDKRVDYIHQAIHAINQQLQKYHSKLNVYYGKPLEIFSQLSQQYDIVSVFCNRDYEPKAIERDKSIYNYLKNKNIAFKAFKDQVIFDKNDILKDNGSPYTVYTPYSKKWKQYLTEDDLRVYDADHSNFLKQDFEDIIPIEAIAFKKTNLLYKEPVLEPTIVADYHKYRDFPALQKTTQLGVALRFGTISVRQCIKFARQHNETWLNELIWREFFMQILFHFPHVEKQSFKQKYDFIQWRNDENEFNLWKEGKTGYPLVDAGMAQLNKTGYMHNRVRMIVASFLCKHLLIDWRWGEAYFALKLNDYDLAANNGNWQWAAGSGCDAAPYFRIFNPTIQIKKFDENYEYIKKWLPEYGTKNYPSPIVDHKFARERVLEVYSNALK